MDFSNWKITPAWTAQALAWNKGVDIGQKLAPYVANFVSSARDNLSGKTEATYQQNFLNQQMAFNREEAEKNREFQRQMSNTAYQRMAQDLVKAGFNPALAVASGGSSTPSGSLASSSLATAPSVTASTTARFNNSVNSLTTTFNNVVNNAVDLLKTYTNNVNDNMRWFGNLVFGKGGSNYNQITWPYR